MYTEFYGLEEKPFALVPDPRFLFLAASHREALAHLLYGIEEGEGFIEVIGNVGTGKTTLCRTLLERVGDEVDLAFIFNPIGNETEMLTAIGREFGLPSGDHSRSELLDLLNRFLLERKAAGRRPVLVIDEAQDLEPVVLEHIRLLSNLETEREKLIQIILIGQPELEEKLSRTDLRQLRQRITVRWSLQPFSRREVDAYLKHRLRVAGLRDGELFSRGAVRALYRASGGIPRLINAIADRTLLSGYTRGIRRVDTRSVRRALRELCITTVRPRSALLGLPRGLAGGLIGLGLLLGLLYAARGPFGALPGSPLPAVGSTAPAAVSGAVPAAAEPSGIPAFAATTLVETLRAQSARGSAARALDVLISSWGYEAAIGPEVDPNLFGDLLRSFSSLQVYATRSTREQLAKMNLPAIVELTPAPDVLRYAALLGLDPDGAVHVAVGEGRFEVAAGELDRLWTGRTFLLWTNFESLPLLSQGMQGSAVRWLQARLTDLGYLRRGDASGEFDPHTERGLRSFQRDHGLEQTGRVGAGTLITLYQELRYGAPRLVSGGTAS